MRKSAQAGSAAAAPAVTMEMMYYTPKLDDVAELADDVESRLNVLQVDGTDDEISDKTDKESVISSPGTDDKKSRGGGKKHKSRTGFKVHLPFGTSAPSVTTQGVAAPAPDWGWSSSSRRHCCHLTLLNLGLWRRTMFHTTVASLLTA